MATGPIALLDFVGLDTALGISKVMAAAFPDRFEVDPLLADLVSMGRLGRKSAAGFRRYDPARIAPELLTPLSSQSSGVIAWTAKSPSKKRRSATDSSFPCFWRRFALLDEGIVRHPADVDLGLVLGLGFPATKGGILAWCDDVGAEVIMNRLARYELLGPAFRPPASLPLMVASMRSFRSL